MSPLPDEDDGFVLRQVLRWGAAFCLLFACVFLAFWWSGAAVHFSAARVGDTAAPAWRVRGTVRDASSGRPVPWAVIQDHPSGRPPFFRAEADQHGNFELLTLAESHQILVTAPNYRPATVAIGRQWFVWLPRGEEIKNVLLTPE